MQFSKTCSMAAIWVWKISSKTVTYFPDDKDDKQDIRVLNELENIDDELDKEGIVIVRLDNDAEAKEYGIDHLPTLVYFENKIPAIYEGTYFEIDSYLQKYYLTLNFRKSP